MDAIAAYNNMIAAIDIRQHGGGFVTPGMQQQAGKVNVGGAGYGFGANGNFGFGGFATPGMQQQAGRVNAGVPRMAGGRGMQAGAGAGMAQPQPMQGAQGMEAFNRLAALWNKVNQEKVIVDQGIQQSVLGILGGQGQQQMMGMNPMGAMNPMGNMGMMNPMGNMGMMNPMGNMGMMNPMGNMGMMNPMGNAQMAAPQPQMPQAQAPQANHHR